MMGFKAFHSAQATIAGIETAHMIRKGQLSEENYFGTPVTKIDSPRDESIVPQFVLRPLQLRTKAATLTTVSFESYVLFQCLQSLLERSETL
jgi:hypothetical protein